MLREEVEQYTNLTGEDGWHVPIMRVGAYLDGYNKGMEVLDKIRAEVIARDRNVKAIRSDGRCFFIAEEVLEIIDMYQAESTSNCDSCKNQNEVDGSNCYECVKGIRNNYKAESEDKV